MTLSVEAKDGDVASGSACGSKRRTQAGPQRWMHGEPCLKQKADLRFAQVAFGRHSLVAALAVAAGRSEA